MNFIGYHNNGLILNVQIDLMHAEIILKTQTYSE